MVVLRQELQRDLVVECQEMDRFSLFSIPTRLNIFDSPGILFGLVS